MTQYVEIPQKDDLFTEFKDFIEFRIFDFFGKNIFLPFKKLQKQFEIEKKIDWQD